MTETTSIDAQSRPPLIRMALLLGGLAAFAWWRQARRDLRLVERTRARLAGGDRSEADPAEPPAPETRAGPGADPLATAAVSLPTNAFLALDRPDGAKANHHYSPDLTGLKIG